MPIRATDLSHLTTTVLQQAMVESMSRGELVPVTTDAMLEYGVDDGTFDQLRAYRVRRGMR